MDADHLRVGRPRVRGGGGMAGADSRQVGYRLSPWVGQGQDLQAGMMNLHIGTKSNQHKDLVLYFSLFQKSDLFKIIYSFEF